MLHKPALKRSRKAKHPNEWLRIVESLDQKMEMRVESHPPKPAKTLLDKNVVEALNMAYTATLHYYTALLESGKHDEKAESLLPRLWQKAGTRMRRYEPALARRFSATNRFWSKAVTWANETIREVWAHLNSIRTSVNILSLRAESFRRANALTS
jgi:hypothetical protein